MTTGAAIDEEWVTWVRGSSGVASVDPAFAVVRRELYDRLVVGYAAPRRVAASSRLRSHLTAPRPRPRWEGLRPAEVLMVVDNPRPTLELAARAVADQLGAAGLDVVVVHGYHRPGAPHARFRYRRRGTRDGGRWFDELARHLPWVTPAGRQEFLRVVEAGEAKLDAARELLDVVQPKVVVTTRDQPPLPAAVALAARERGVPSAALQHGTTGPRDTPVQADRYLLWGRHGRDRMAPTEPRPDALVIVGSPRHDDLRRVARATEPATARARLGLGVDRPVFVYFGSGHVAQLAGPEPVAGSQAWIADLVRRLDDRWSVAVRPHPSERPGLWDATGAVVLGAAGADATTEALVAADVVGGLYSTVLEEATLVGRPALQLLDPTWPDMAPTWRDGGARRVVDAADADRALRELEDPEARTAQVAAQAPFGERVFGPDGAAGRAAEVVAAMARAGATTT